MGIIFVHGEDRSGSGVQLRIAVEIDRPGIEPRTGCNIESGTFSGNFLGYGMAIHIERATPAGFELIHRGHALLERNRLVGHVESPVDNDRTVLAVIQLRMAVEPEVRALRLAVVVEFRIVGDFDLAGLQHARGAIIELTGVVDVEQSVDNERTFVDHGLAGKVGFPGGELTAKIAGLGAFCCMFALASRMYTSPPGSTASVAWPIVTEASSVSLPAT